MLSAAHLGAMKRRFAEDLESVFERPGGRENAAGGGDPEFGQEGEKAWSRATGYSDQDLESRFGSQQNTSNQGVGEQLMDEATIKRLLAEERRKALDPSAAFLSPEASQKSTGSRTSRQRSESPPLPAAEWLTQGANVQPPATTAAAVELPVAPPSPPPQEPPPKKKKSRWGQPASMAAAESGAAAEAAAAEAAAAAAATAAAAAAAESSARASAGAAASLCSGDLVRLQGLQNAAHLNGEKARLVQLDHTTGRWEVRLLKNMESKAIKPENLEPQDSDDEEALQQTPPAPAAADSWIPPRSPTPERIAPVSPPRAVEEPPVAPPSPPQQAPAPVYGTGRSASGVAGLSSGSLAGGPSVAQRFAALPLAAKPRGPPRQMGTVRWYNGRRKLGVVIPDSGGPDLFIPAQGAVNGSQVPPQPGGLFHGTRVSFQPVALKNSEKKETVCMDVRPLSGQVGLSAGVETFIGAKEKNDDRIAATDLRELGFFAGIFDGHLGSNCAEFVSKQVPKNVLEAYRARVKREGGSVAKLTPEQEARVIAKAIVEAFEEADKAYLVTARKKDLSDGSTGLVTLLCHGFQVPQPAATAASLWPPDRNAQKQICTAARAPGGVAKLFVAWCGDSRAVLLRGRQGLRLSEDHRPNNTNERQRVRAAGGTVTKDARGIWRVGPREENRFARELDKRKKKEATSKWYLSTSRSFGDLALKVPDAIVTATPEVKVVDLVPEDWAVVLGSDGIFDVLSDQQVANVLYKAMAVDGKDPVAAAKELVQAAFRAGSRDNLTAVTMRLGWSPAPSSDDPILVGEAATEQKKDDGLDMFG